MAAVDRRAHECSRPSAEDSAVAYTLTVFSIDIGGAERVLRRTLISDDAVGAYIAAPGAALNAMLPVGETWPDGFRIMDGNGRLRLDHTGVRRTQRVS